MKGSRRKEETKFVFVRALLDVRTPPACRSGQVAFGAYILQPGFIVSRALSIVRPKLLSGANYRGVNIPACR